MLIVFDSSELITFLNCSYENFISAESEDKKSKKVKKYSFMFALTILNDLKTTGTVLGYRKFWSMNHDQHLDKQ